MIDIVRYGKMLPVKQTGNFGGEDFHNAPEPEGFYCFNKIFYEPFLVGEKRYERDRYHATIVDGYIWIHIEPKRNMIIEQKDSWFKIRVQDYKKIMINNYRAHVEKFDGNWKIKYAKDHLEIFCTKETKLANVRKAFNKAKHRGIEKSNEIYNENDEREMRRWDFNWRLREEQEKSRKLLLENKS